MSPLIVALAAGATAGAVVALVARDGRIAVLGVTVALVLAPLLTDPVPEPALLAVRVLGGLLAGYLLWIGLRDSSPDTRGTAFGAIALGLAAVTAFIAGVAGHGLDAEPVGPAAAQASGTAIIVISLIPVIRAREAFRLAVGLLLLLLGVTLLRVGLAGPPDALETIATTVALVVVAGAGMAVAGLVYGDVGDFEFRAPEPEMVRHRPTDEAHRQGAAGSAGPGAAATAADRSGDAVPPPARRRRPRPTRRSPAEPEGSDRVEPPRHDPAAGADTESGDADQPGDVLDAGDAPSAGDEQPPESPTTADADDRADRDDGDDGDAGGALAPQRGRPR